MTQSKQVDWRRGWAAVSEAGNGSGKRGAFGARQTRGAVGAGAAVRQLLGLLERHLENSAAELVAVQGGYRHQCVLVVGHRHEAVTFALGRRKVTHHLFTQQLVHLMHNTRYNNDKEVLRSVVFICWLVGCLVGPFVR